MIWGIIFDVISRLVFPGLGVSEIEPKKSDYPDRPNREAFSKIAEDAISKPSKIVSKPVSFSATAKRDKEFWETI